MDNNQRSVIIRVHEIALKGNNRPFFFEQLVRNIKKALRGTAAEKVRKEVCFIYWYKHRGVCSPLSEVCFPLV